MVTVKLICLFFAVWFTMINIIRLIQRTNIPAGNILIQAIGTVMFIVIQFKLYQ